MDPRPPDPAAPDPGERTATPDPDDRTAAPDPGERTSGHVQPDSPGIQGPASRREFAGRLGVGLVMAACGVLFVTTSRISGGGSIRDESSSVAEVLRERDRTIGSLTDSAADKRARIDELTRKGGGSEHRTQLVADAVGLSSVVGPGVRVTLSDAPTSALGSIPGVTPDDLVVHQQDMEAFVNALWAGGAEAMMLQDQRVINGSAFRCAGNTLLLEGRVYSPPFVITAIGDPDALMAALDSAPSVALYREWVDYVGLGERSETIDEVTLPAFEGSLTIDVARAG